MIIEGIEPEIQYWFWLSFSICKLKDIGAKEVIIIIIVVNLLRSSSKTRFCLILSRFGFHQKSHLLGRY